MVINIANSAAKTAQEWASERDDGPQHKAALGASNEAPFSIYYHLKS